MSSSSTCQPYKYVDFLFNSCNTPITLAAYQWADKNDENAMVPIINEPKDLVVIVAGGAGGKSMWCPTAGAQSLSVSKVIERGA